MKQIPLPITFDARPSFESFVPGPNQAALQHLSRLRLPSPPVYLWGPPGSGKTHLLEALAHRCQESGLQVGWFDPVTATPWVVDERGSLVIVDRCEELGAAAQQSAFELFVLAGNGVQWAAAGRLPPVDLPLREDLRTRLGWGHVFALHPLSEAETRAALRRQAEERGIFLSDEVMDHVLTRQSRDLGNLMGLLDRLDRFSLARSRPITIPLLRRMLQEEDVELGAMGVAP